jgi:hypothetical protein
MEMPDHASAISESITLNLSDPSERCGGRAVWSEPEAPLSLRSYLTGVSTGAPLSFTMNTRNFAGLVWLAFRPTT